MKELLQNYVNAVFRGTSVRIYRSTEQLGLIRARLTGIRMAKARVVVSMDSHMEVQPRWSVLDNVLIMQLESSNGIL